MKIYRKAAKPQSRKAAKGAKWRKGEWVIDKNPVFLCVPSRTLRLCGKHLAVTQRCTPSAARVLLLERKMDEQEVAEEAEDEWHAKMDGLTRKSCFRTCQFQ